MNPERTEAGGGRVGVSGIAEERGGQAGTAGSEVLTRVEAAIEELRQVETQLREQNRDLTEAKRRAERDSLRFRELFELAPDAYIVTDRASAVREANGAASRLLGVGIEELSGAALTDFISAADHPCYHGLLETAVASAAGGGPALAGPRELAVRRQDGDPVPVEARVSAGGVGDGADEVRWLFRDVRDRKRAEVTERRLRQEQARRQASEMAERHASFLAVAAEALSATLGYDATARRIAELAVPRLADTCLVFLREPDGLLRCGGAAHADPALDAGFADFVGSTFPIGACDRLRRVIESGETEYLTADRQHEVASLLPPPLRPGVRPAGGASVLALRARGRTLGAILLLEPASLRESDRVLGWTFADRAALALDNARLYVEAQQASQAKSDFIAVMSHEFRTPLTSVLGYAELLETEIAGPLTDRQRRFVRSLRASGWHLTQLIDQILTFTRSEAARAELRRDRIRVSSLLGEVIELFRPAAAAKGLVLRMPEAPPDFELETDAGKLRQVLFNLVDNAVKFTDRGAVTLGAVVDGDALLIRVRDTGIGIAPDQFDRIWQPFAQLDPSATRVRGGAGLGLAVSQRLISSLDGELTVQSTPGKGSTFTVRLRVHPVYDPSA